jgi:hypothetical protein
MKGTRHVDHVETTRNQICGSLFKHASFVKGQLYKGESGVSGLDR